MGHRVGGRHIDGVDHLGSGQAFADKLSGGLRAVPVFKDLTSEEAKLLAGYLDVYRVKTGTPFIFEGDEGSFMVVVLGGQVNVFKQFEGSNPKLVAVVGSGKTLGEMSMIDGEPRFATCVAAEDTTFAMLDRKGFLQIMEQRPGLAAKILLPLVVLLNQRLRHASAKLLEVMESGTARK
ncbi:MAG TPA: cyclic nucleotide-binding domain-containing protein [Burkholderiales bacterium]|nr:cyclic nucleotide-binding domain-containing protein [Betaproteobacteria bacterium]HQR51724.1 cyclic nucleotide-binding domain-containing protein [Burkholderiales bacterium]